MTYQSTHPPLRPSFNIKLHFIHTSPYSGAWVHYSWEKLQVPKGRDIKTKKVLWKGEMEIIQCEKEVERHGLVYFLFKVFSKS